MFELDQRRAGLEQQIADQRALLQHDREAAVREPDAAQAHLAEIRKAVVATEELAGRTPLDAKRHLAGLAGETLEFREVPDALEYRQCLAVRGATRGAAIEDPL